MPVRILVPTPLRPFTGQQSVVAAEGATVGELLRALTTTHPDLRPHLFSAEGALRSFVNVYVNDDDIRHLKREDTPVGPADTVSIVPSVAGGSEALSNDEIQRYSRHLIIPEVGVEGQRRLKDARVVCIGAGGLGSPASLYLAAAGVGTLGVVDFDVVDFSNLQRQILFSSSDVGRRKVEAAAGRLTSLNPEVRVVTHEAPLTSQNALDILRDYDVVVDGADNFPTRYLVNDACVLLGIPNAYGSIFRFDGQASVFATKGGPCYRCLYPEPPPPGLVPSCAEGGVLGVLPGIIGTIQATEAIKLILGIGTTLAGRLLLLDALSMEFRTMKLRRDPACPVCGDHPTVTALIDYQQFCGIPAVTAAATATQVPEISVDALKSALDRDEHPWILDVREPREFEICRIPGSTLIPLGDLPKRLSEIPQGTDAPAIVVHCKMGGRSAKAVALLRDRGITNARNLTGGILAWIDRVDPTLPKY
jgi:molybdopterin/thiamine biosynthesis adenylyltransferase/rhodanese-related sulfurtransferase/molybdopterin converting factor small subunit